MHEFAEALTLADKVVLADIYAARGNPTTWESHPKICGIWWPPLVHDAYYFSTFDEIEEFLLKTCIHDRFVDQLWVPEMCIKSAKTC